MNSRAIDGLEALGYTPPRQQTASPREYRTLIDDVREAVNRYKLREVVRERHDETIPEWASDLEIADRAFTLHVSDELDLTAVKEIEETGEDEVVVDTWEPPHQFFADTDGPAVLTDLYFPETEGENRIVEQIDHALRSGKHIISTSQSTASNLT